MVKFIKKVQKLSCLYCFCTLYEAYQMTCTQGGGTVKGEQNQDCNLIFLHGLKIIEQLTKMTIVLELLD